MRITPNKFEIPGVSIRKSAAKKDAEASASVSSGDQVTVSEKAREIGRLKLDIATLPDMQTDRIEDLKRDINNGTYRVDSQLVADKFLRELIINHSEISF